MKVLFIFIFIVHSVFFLLANDDYSVSLSRVTPEGGVTYNSILCIGEDEMGFIWFGSNDGLFRYDSKEIVRYSHFQNNPASIPTNRINDLYKDQNGTLWIATENGLCSYSSISDNFKNYSIKSISGAFIGKNIHSFFQDEQNRYWFGDEIGFGIVNPDLGIAEYQKINNKVDGIRRLYIDTQNTIWVFFRDGEIYYKLKESETFHFFSKGLPNALRDVLVEGDRVWIAYESHGLLCLNSEGVEQAYLVENNGIGLSLPSNQVRSLHKDELGHIWAATYNGIAIIKDYEVLTIVDQNKYSELPNHSIWSIFQDSRKRLWIGTYLGGLCFHSKYNNSFLHYTQSAPYNTLAYNVVSSFVQVPKSAEMIVGTEDGNLNYFNPETNSFSSVQVKYDGNIVSNIKSLTFDKNGILWIGTYGHGVLYQKKRGEDFKKLELPFPSGIQALDIHATNNGIWVCNYPIGAYFYDFNSKQFKNYRHNPWNINSLSNNNVRQIIEDQNGNFWFATRYGLNLLERDTEVFIDYYHVESDSTSIASNIIYAIHEDEDGYLWLGTNGQGLDKFDPRTGTAIHYTVKDGLPGNEIFSILQDDENKLWITTNKGLCMFDPSTKEIRSFNHANGIYNNRFNPNCAISTQKGELYFGGTNGFIRFVPQDIKLNPEPPQTIITDLYVNNQLIIPYDNFGILDDIASKTKSIKVHFKQNTLGFRFVTNNYIESSRNTFQYRMVGLNDEWVETDNNDRVNFTKIPPGNYTFEVKAANNDGIWNNVPTQISIWVVPPIWLRWYAYVAYFLFVIAAIGYFRQQIINRQKLKSEIELERITRDNEEQMHRLKLQFFTNISHEFRTPLTLIQGPVNQLLRSKVEGFANNKQLSLIKNNTERLLRLVNQFLDFRKIDSGKIKLSPVQSDVVLFCKNVVGCFEDYAKNRGFTFEFSSDVSKLRMDFDPEKLDKVLFNLISNAFKNTADGGTIKVNLLCNSSINSVTDEEIYKVGEKIEDDFIEISVSDTGKGISKQNIPHIFERFYRLESTHVGTGIGLSLSKNYVLLHEGVISVKSELNKGSIFTVAIPQNQEGAYKKITKEDSILNQVDFSTEQHFVTSPPEVEIKKVTNSEALILIVEDNSELLNYLSDILQKHFRVAKAGNGRIAMEQVNSLYPDLIVSDIMMPEMDGIELCQALKNDIRTSHIPLVLLTALDTVKDRISGLTSGADAYISKPFNDNLLIVQINNLLDSRKALWQSFGSIETEWEDNYCSLDLDKKLLLKAIRMVEENMTNVDFSVEQLASGLNLSRTHLHRKLKALTNQSATEFIRYVRLKQAVQLLKDGKHKVSEVGYAVGFNSHNYFTKSFKKQFGKAPSEFLQDIPRHFEN